MRQRVTHQLPPRAMYIHWPAPLRGVSAGAADGARRARTAHFYGLRKADARPLLRAGRAIASPEFRHSHAFEVSAHATTPALPPTTDARACGAPPRDYRRSPTFYHARRRGNYDAQQSLGASAWRCRYFGHVIDYRSVTFALLLLHISRMFDGALNRCMRAWRLFLWQAERRGRSLRHAAAPCRQRPPRYHPTNIPPRLVDSREAGRLLSASHLPAEISASRCR